MCMQDIRIGRWIQTKQHLYIGAGFVTREVVSYDKTRVGIDIAGIDRNSNLVYGNTDAITAVQGAFWDAGQTPILRFRMWEDGDVTTKPWFVYTEAANANLYITEYNLPAEILAMSYEELKAL